MTNKEYGSRSLPVESERLPFVVMAKPIGSICNMRCDYCYYLDTAYAAPPKRMSDEVLQAFIRGYIEASPGSVISFTWHGGEPALCGIPFFEQVIRLQQQYLPDGIRFADAGFSGKADVTVDVEREEKKELV